MLALRNAIDDAQLDLAAEASSLLGPLGAPARRIFEAARGHVIGSSRQSEQLR